MENFDIYNPTKAIFGKYVIQKLSREVKHFGTRVLLVYGKGSIKRNGIYDAVMEQLKIAGAEVTEYAGIRPNPIIEDVREAVKLGKEKNVNLVLAVGGGSVVDSAKVIGNRVECDPGWLDWVLAVGTCCE